MVSRFQAVTREKTIERGPGSISLGLCATRWRPGLRAVSGTGKSRREKMRLVARIAPDHGQIGMLLVWDEAFWAPLLSRSPGQCRPGIGYGGVLRRARVVGRAAVLCSFPCGARMPCTAVSS